MTRVTLVTGCASGIGRGLAQRLYARGDTVIATDIDEPGLQAAAREGGWTNPDRIVLRRLDVRDPKGWEQMVDEIVTRWGVLDVLVNVAGFLVPVWAKDATTADVDRTFDINAKGLIHGTNAAIRQMVAQKHGHVVNVASVAGLVPVPGLALYSASKHAARAYSIAAGQEVREHGVFVTAICPTVVATPMMDIQIDREEAAFVFSGKRALTVDEVVTAIVERAMVKKPLELVLDVPWSGQGAVARAGNIFPGIGLALQKYIRKTGRSNQEKLKR
jgi:3-oxoacyl-[acyl-carrier protein] reductase